MNSPNMYGYVKYVHIPFHDIVLCVFEKLRPLKCLFIYFQIFHVQRHNSVCHNIQVLN